MISRAVIRCIWSLRSEVEDNKKPGWEKYARKENETRFGHLRVEVFMRSGNIRRLDIDLEFDMIMTCHADAVGICEEIRVRLWL